MSSNNVADSTDWLSTPLSGLAAVEAAFRCQVCKDFYSTPMITSCSHTFCSLCIRRALSSDGKCPMCRAPEQEMKLRSNWSMEEAVEAFCKARQMTLDLAQNSLLKLSSPKRKAEDHISNSQTPPEPKRLRTSARLSGKTRPYIEEQPGGDHVNNANMDEVDIGTAIEDDKEYLPEPDDGLVSCPVCQIRMKEWQVFKHLEACPGPKTGQQRQEDRSPRQGGESSTTNGFNQAQRTQNVALERLPALNYSLLKEQALRKKMWDMGLPNHGPRNLLERRHREWITLWNANCDSLRPKKRSELLHDLDAWERTHGARAFTNRPVQNGPNVKDKEFDGAAWAAKHDSSFKDLIAIARNSREAATKKRDNEQKPPLADHVIGTAVDLTQDESPLRPATAEADAVEALPVSSMPPILVSGQERAEHNDEGHYGTSAAYSGLDVLAGASIGNNTSDVGVESTHGGRPQ